MTMNRYLFIVTLMASMLTNPATAKIDLKEAVADHAKDELASTLVSLPGLNKLSEFMEQNQVRTISGPRRTLVNFDSQLDKKFDIAVGKTTDTLFRIGMQDNLRLDAGNYVIGFINEGKLVSSRQLIIPPRAHEIIEPGTPIYPNKGKIPVLIKPYPSDSKVQILDIKPKYQDNMLIKPRTYKVKISRNGYQSFRGKLAVSSTTPVHHIVLKPL